MSNHYFTFPLAVLTGELLDNCLQPRTPTPLDCIVNALYCGTHGAGIGFKHHHGHEDFKERLEEVCDKLDMTQSSRPGARTSRAEVLVGADICNVTLGDHSAASLERIVNRAESVLTGGALVRMKADYFWAAYSQARAETYPDAPWPERGVSWREFRVLCAILSVQRNRAGFAFIGWETIQSRSCGFTKKEDFKNAESIPDHLAPPLSHKQIRTTRDKLEALGFYARFRFSRGSRGGLMAYSVRHDRDALAAAVCDHVNFQDGVSVRKNREDDALKCLQLLERAKSGQSQDNEGGKDEGKGRGKHNEKSNDEKSNG